MSLPKSILTTFSVLLAINFFASVSITHTLDFAAQQDTRKAFNYMDSIGAKHIAMNQETYGVYINYYQQTDNMKYHFVGDYMNAIRSADEYDYVLLSAPPAALSPVFNKDKLSTLKRFNGNNITLLKITDH